MKVQEAMGLGWALLSGGRRSRREACPERVARRAGRPASAPRHGVIAVVALACVAAASVVMVVAVRRALAEARLVRWESQRTQCHWLAESALQRAAARLASNPKYEGETWRIPASLLTGRDEGEGAAVTIEVATPAADASRRVVRVRADWPENAPARVRVSKQATIAVR